MQSAREPRGKSQIERQLLTTTFLRLVLRLSSTYLLPGIEAIHKLLQSTYVIVCQTNCVETCFNITATSRTIQKDRYQVHADSYVAEKVQDKSVQK
jgi:hypothetical protein